jgi:hypothetical protein
MMPGFLHRFNAELINLVNISTYVNKLAIREFHFHSPPSQLNYAAWLGGSFVLFEIICFYFIYGFRFYDWCT